MQDAIEHVDDRKALTMLAEITLDELESNARFQANKQTGKPYHNVPQWVIKAGWWDSEGKWHNIFWYH